MTRKLWFFSRIDELNECNWEHIKEIMPDDSPQSDMETLSNSKWTMLMHASFLGIVDFVKWCLNRRANCEAADMVGPPLSLSLSNPLLPSLCLQMLCCGLNLGWNHIFDLCLSKWTCKCGRYAHQGRSKCWLQNNCESGFPLFLAPNFAVFSCSFPSFL